MTYEITRIYDVYEDYFNDCVTMVITSTTTMMSQMYVLKNIKYDMFATISQDVGMHYMLILEHYLSYFGYFSEMKTLCH